MSVITLTTDFGTEDPYVGLMKGVILGIAPEARIVDLSHAVPPGNVLAGALVLEAAAADYFPVGTIHVGVVDPGVGTQRPAIAVRTSRSFFVGPDNGLFTAALAQESVQQVVELTNAKYHRQPVSGTFHGRDIFAPVAAHLARGVALEALGPTAARLVQLDLPRVRELPDSLELHVLRVDRFGNLVTDLTHQQYQMWWGRETRKSVVLQAGSVGILGIARTYADVMPGQALAYFGSSGRLEIAVRGGDASRTLGLGPGGAIWLRQVDR